MFSVSIMQVAATAKLNDGCGSALRWIRTRNLRFSGPTLPPQALELVCTIALDSRL